MSSRVRHGVFISYARTDGESVAAALHARLAADAPDIPAWLDRYEIEGGVGWWNQIERELDRAEFLMLVMTPSAMHSENTRREWASARQRGVCVYPVKGAPDSDLDYDSIPSWMRRTHFYDPDVEWQKLVAHLRRGCQATRVPFMAPPLPPTFVPRTSASEALLRLLLAGKKKDGKPTTVALRGPGGFGKTIFATAICHDDAAIEAFDDGILWVTLGQSPNVLNELVKLYAALTGERPSFVDAEDAARELAVKLESKNCLLVIDDAWNAAHVRPFLLGGSDCARLITTRLFDLAGDDAQRMEIERMTPSEALELLIARMGADPPDRGPFCRLVERLGEWPLPIKLAGSVMRQRLDRGDTAEKALEYVTRALNKRGITAFDNQAPGESAVARTVGASLDLLTPDEKRRCTELVVFPEDEGIPVTAVAALWELDEIDSEDLSRKLDDIALVEFDLRRGLLHMHDVLREFLGSYLPDAASVHGRLVAKWGDPYALPDTYAWRRYAFHLFRAGHESTLRKLLLDLDWLHAKLRATDIHSLLSDFDDAGSDRVLGLVRAGLALSAPILAADPGQLHTQLIGRLLGSSEPELVAWCETMRETAHATRLTLLHPTLDAPGGMLLMTLVGHGGAVTSLAIDDDYSRLLSGSNDGTVRVWDPGNGQLVTMLYPKDRQPKNVLFGDVLGVRTVASTPDGHIVLSGNADGFMYLWDVKRGEVVHRFSRGAGRAVRAVALAADSRLAVCATRERNIRVWDVGARTVLRVLSGHTEEVTSVALSADGTRAVSGSDDCTVRVWNPMTGRDERTFEGHTGPVNAVALSADGRHVLSGSSDRTVKLWDAETGACLRTLFGHEAGVTSVALAATVPRAISGSSDRSAYLWCLESGNVLARLAGHGDAVNAVVIDDAGTRAATGSVDRTIKLWCFDNLRPSVPVAAHSGAVVSLVFTAEGRWCASGGDDGRIMVRNVESGALVHTIEAHTAPVRSLAFTDDGCVLSAGVDHRYSMWTINNGEGTWMPVRHSAPVDCCALSATVRYLATACSDRFVYLWDVPSGTLIARYGTRRLFDHLIPPAPRRRELPDSDDYRDTYIGNEPVYEVVGVHMSTDGSFAVFSAVARDPESLRNAVRPQSGGRAAQPSSSACLLALNVATGEIRSLSGLQTEPIRTFAIDADGTRLLWARQDHTLELWDLLRDERIATMQGHSETVNAVCFSGHASRVISCARDRTLRIWDVRTGKQVDIFTADAALRALAVNPHSSVLATGDVGGRVHLLNLEFE